MLFKRPLRHDRSTPVFWRSAAASRAARRRRGRVPQTNRCPRCGAPRAGPRSAISPGAAAPGRRRTRWAPSRRRSFTPTRTGSSGGTPGRQCRRSRQAKHVDAATGTGKTDPNSDDPSPPDCAGRACHRPSAPQDREGTPLVRYFGRALTESADEWEVVDDRARSPSPISAVVD